MQNLKKNLKYYFLGLLFLITLFVWYAVFAESRDGLLVAFLDVGQGDAIFIQTGNGNQILLDGGPNRAVLRELSKIMPFYDRSIDMIIASHPDKDHIAGLIDALKRYNVALAMESGVHSGTATYQELNKIINAKKIQKILAKRGMRIKLDNGIYIDILFPDRDVDDLDTNTGSIVAKLVYGSTSFLFTGDSPKSIESYLVAIEDKGLRSDVLKTSHHGSKTSSSESFLGYVSPQYAVISVGKDNSYGHPHQEILDILEKFEVQVLRTDEVETIKIKSDGENIAVSN